MLEYNICYSLDSKYVEQLAVSICSILKNALPADKINFYILDGGLTPEQKSDIEELKSIKDFSIKYININKDEFANCPLNVIKNGDKYEPTHVTLPAYFRIKLPSLLKELDKILYLDCDVVVRTSLKELFEQDVTDKAVLMTLDAESEKEAERLGIKRYFNSGVLFINLDYWRKNDVENKLLGYINKNQRKILWFDQDVINVVLEGQIGEISNKWNYQYFQYEKIDINEFANSSIIHMAGRFKPWLMSFEHPVYDLYYYYLSFTGWRKNITVYKNMAMGRHLKNGIGGCITNITVDATDEDIQKVYSELGNTYKLFDTTKEFLESKIEVVKNELYEDLEKNYEFTKGLNEDLEKNYEFTKGLNEDLKYVLNLNTDEKISKVYEEITRNYEYTNRLVEDVKTVNAAQREEMNNIWLELELCGEKFEEKIYYENAHTDEKISKVYEEISNNYKYTEKLASDIIVNAEENAKNYTDSKIRELYSYTNEEVAKSYNAAKINYQSFESRIDNKARENSRRIEDVITKLYEIDASKPDFNQIKNINEKIMQLELQNKMHIEEMRKLFEDELNNQRIKYENRLIEMEKIISSFDNRYQLKKNGFFKRIINKLKKRRNK